MARSSCTDYAPQRFQPLYGMDPASLPAGVPLIRQRLHRSWLAAVAPLMLRRYFNRYMIGLHRLLPLILLRCSFVTVTVSGRRLAQLK